MYQLLTWPTLLSPIPNTIAVEVMAGIMVEVMVIGAGITVRFGALCTVL